MKKTLTLLMFFLTMVGTAKADVEWTIWDGTNTDNVYVSKDLIASMEVGDKIIVSFSQTDAGQDGELCIGWNTIAYNGVANDYFDYTNNKVTIEITTTLKNQVAGTTAYTKYYYSEGWQSESVTGAGDLRVKANGSLSFSKIVLQKQHSYIVKNYNVSVNTGNWEKSTNVHPSGLTSEDYLYFAATPNAGGTYWQAQLGGTGINVTGGFWFPASESYSTWNDSDVELKGYYIDVTGMKQYHPVSSFSIGSIGYATFSADQQVTAPASVKAYKATVDGSTVKLTQFTDNVIPANTGAIIAGDEGAVLEFTASSESTSETSDLIACTTATDVTTLAESGYDLYVLHSGTGASETNLELSTLLSSISDWGGKVTVSTSEPWTAEWTSSSTSSTMGKWLGSDWSTYDKLRLVFTSNTVTETVHFGLSYNGQSDSENTGADLATGELTVDIPLNASHKSAMGNFSFNSNATSGSLTFESAALIDNDGATVAEFRKTTSGTLKANKAYLKIPSGSISSAPILKVVIGDEINTTGIANVGLERRMKDDNRIFNLNGQEVKVAKRGLFIKNGKKYFVK